MNPLKILITDKLGSFVRTGIAAGAGALVAFGVLDASSSATVTDSLATASLELISGLALYLIAQASSLLNKKAK